MNILVTGANGQLGSEMRRLGAVSPNNYIFTDVAELDITNAVAVAVFVKQHSIDAIINCAAYTNVDKAESVYSSYLFYLSFSNLYPNPFTVLIIIGFFESSSILFLRLLICIIIVLSSP